MLIYEPRCCEACDKKVGVTIFGTYRRHFTTGPSGRRQLCPASGSNALSPAEAAAARRRRRLI